MTISEKNALRNGARGGWVLRVREYYPRGLLGEQRKDGVLEENWFPCFIGESMDACFLYCQDLFLVSILILVRSIIASWIE